MSRSVAVLLVLVFLTASSIAVKPALSSTDVVEDSWVSKAPMQQARAGLGVVAVNGKIYAIGGSTASGPYRPDRFAGGFVGTNEEYDPETDTWTYRAPMPTPRAHFAIAAYQNKIYCIGGAVGFTVDEWGVFYSYVTSGVNEVYDTVTDTWETRASLPDDAMKFQAHVVDGKIYVMDWSYTYVYDPADDSWALKKQMPSPSLLSSLVSAVVDNKIIVTGEFSTGYPTFDEEQRIMIYDTETDSWSQGSTGPTIVIGGAAGATTGANALQRVIVLGLARGLPSSFGNQVYDPKTDTWATATAMPALRMDFGVAVVDEVFYVIGGYSYTSDRYDSARPVAVNEQYYPLGYGTPDPFYVLAHTPPEMSFLSPLNRTYYNSSVALVFTLDKPVNWTSYSLDGALNVTVAGNTTVTGLSMGLHNVTVYAEDTFGNVGASETIYFSIAEPFPTTLVIAPIASVAVVGIGLIVYFKKRKH